MNIVSIPLDEPITTGMLARITGHPRDRVVYAVNRLGLTPAGRAGNVRIFSHEAAGRIIAELERLERRARRPEQLVK